MRPPQNGLPGGCPSFSARCTCSSIAGCIVYVCVCGDSRGSSAKLQTLLVTASPTEKAGNDCSLFFFFFPITLQLTSSDPSLPPSQTKAKCTRHTVRSLHVSFRCPSGITGEVAITVWRCKCEHTAIANEWIARIRLN